MKRAKLVAIYTSVSMAALNAPALAQEASPPQDETSSTGQGIEEIIVTAQRRAESLQKAAIAVSAVGADALETRGITTTEDISKLVPALVIQQTGGTNVNPYLRGVGAFGSGPGSENAVSFSIDGVFIGRPSGTLGSFYDLERVEVLKGPQGTLYGRNSTGGAINLVSRKPRLGDRSGNVQFEVGNYESVRAQASVNLPLGDNAALRVAGQVINRAGYLTRGYDDDSGQAARAQLLYKPTDRLSILIGGDYYNQKSSGPGSILVPNNVVPTAPPIADRVSGADPRSLAVLSARFPGQVASLFLPTDEGYVKGEFWGVSASIDYDLGFATLTAIPAYRSSSPEYVSFRPGFFQSQGETAEQFTGELRLASNEDRPFGYVLGLFYFDQNQDSFTVNKQAINNQNQNIFNISTKSWAAFGQLTYSLTDRLRVVGGARYTKETRDQDALTRGPTAADPNPAYVPLNGSTDFDRVTWKAGLEFDAAPRSLVYASVATGFKSGGVGQYSPTRPDLNNFAPESLTAYTLGSKNRFFDNTLQFNVEAFYWDYRDQQLGVLVPRIENPTSIGQRTINIGKARFYGVDMEAVWQPTRRDTFNLNVQYLNSKYLDFVYERGVAGPVGGTGVNCPSTQISTGNPRRFIVDCSGKTGINAPEWSLSGGYEHEFPISDTLNLTAAVSSQYQSSRILGTEFADEQRQPAVMISDAFLTLESSSERWSVTAFVNNIENATVRNQVFQRTIQGSTSPTGPLAVYYAGLRPPRTYGVRANFRF